MRSILEAYYEPQFSPHSHGFRSGRGCHTALKEIFHTWTGTRWFIEGDIKGCFDSIDHTALLSILREKIHDNRFLTLVENLLEAGYLEQWDYRPTLSGTPQGGIASPLLSNIYLDRLDGFVEKTLIPRYTRGEIRRRNKDYVRLIARIRKLRKDGADEASLKPLRSEARRIGHGDQHDPGYRRLRYIRYADDFLLGFTGPKEEAEEIKVELGQFLKGHLKLDLSPEKTLVTHAGTERARFLGYDIGVNTVRADGRSMPGRIQLRLPIQKLEAKIAKYMRGGKPAHRTEIRHESDFSIVDKYGSEFRGIAQYYALAKNRYWLHHLQWVMGRSLLRTLANNHKTTVRKMARRLTAEVYHQGRMRMCLEVKLERPGKEPLTARFGGIRLTTDPLVNIEDRFTDRDRTPPPRAELITRLMAGTCELCGSREEIQIHHVRKLADLNVRGRRERPSWMLTMAALKRKTLVVCKRCHVAIHAGQPTRRPTEVVK